MASYWETDSWNFKVVIEKEVIGIAMHVDYILYTRCNIPKGQQNHLIFEGTIGIELIFYRQNSEQIWL